MGDSLILSHQPIVFLRLNATTAAVRACGSTNSHIRTITGKSNTSFYKIKSKNNNATKKEKMYISRLILSFPLINSCLVRTISFHFSFLFPFGFFGNFQFWWGRVDLRERAGEREKRLRKITFKLILEYIFFFNKKRLIRVKGGAFGVKSGDIARVSDALCEIVIHVDEHGKSLLLALFSLAFVSWLKNISFLY